jgi:transposase
MNRIGKTLSSQQATDWREGRRLRAWELKQEGWKQQDIARALGVSKGAVSQWMKRAQQEGIEALKHRPPPGAKARLSEDERAKLPELLARGATAHGFRGEVWTCARVAEAIRKELVRRQLPSGARQPGGAGSETLPAETDASGQPTR